MNNLEKEIQTDLLEYLEYIGAWTVKTIESNKRGVPDIICCLGGRFVAIEVKRKGKAPRVIQSHQIKKVEEAGGIAFSASSRLDVLQNLAPHFDLPNEAGDV